MTDDTMTIEKAGTANKDAPGNKRVQTESTPKLAPPDVFDDGDLLAPPLQRAAYSDRTAWLMCAMSELAYFKFEGGQNFTELAADLISIRSEKDIVDHLRRFLSEMETTAADGREALARCLKAAGFELVNVYNQADTQAFLAKRPAKGKARGMRILAFRGTEKNLEDLKTDVDADLITLPEGHGNEKVHDGFYKAFKTVEGLIAPDLQKDKDLPLYITGHSLGGALAVVATRLIAGDSLGACYTFGGPRVGNLDFGQVFRTPVYRVVNAADIVPRVPPAFVVPMIVAVLNWLPIPVEPVTAFLERFRGYVHFGDMRYLNHVTGEAGGQFDGLKLIANPSLPLRAGWVVRRWVATAGKGGIEDHSISLYRKKLRAWANQRSQVDVRADVGK